MEISEPPSKTEPISPRDLAVHSPKLDPNKFGNTVQELLNNKDGVLHEIAKRYFTDDSEQISLENLAKMFDIGLSRSYGRFNFDPLVQYMKESVAEDSIAFSELVNLAKEWLKLRGTA